MRRVAEAADEILVSEPAAANLGLHVGDEIILRLLLAREIARFSQGFGQPDGGFARVRVVGITRAPAWAEPATDVSVTPAFARVHASDVSSRGVFVRLRSTDPASRDAFAAALAAAYAADPYHSPLDGLLRPEPYFPTTGVDPTVRAAQVVLLAGLVVFGVVVGLGGLLIVAQGLLRHHGGRPPRPAHRARARDDPGRARGGAGAGRRGRERSPRVSPVPWSRWPPDGSSLWAARPGSSPPRGSGRRGRSRWAAVSRSRCCSAR